MNYFKFLLGAKWIIFVLFFGFLNVAGVWAMLEDSTNWYWVTTILLILDATLIIFSYNECKLTKDADS